MPLIFAGDGRALSAVDKKPCPPFNIVPPKAAKRHVLWDFKGCKPCFTRLLDSNTLFFRPAGPIGASRGVVACCACCACCYVAQVADASVSEKHSTRPQRCLARHTRADARTAGAALVTCGWGPARRNTADCAYRWRS